MALFESFDRRINQINETLNKLPVARIHHFSQATAPEQTTPVIAQPTIKKKKGCYVATCVYGSYDCPQVWVLRRYRDNTLANSCFGRAFIKIYYALSPLLVKCFGKYSWFAYACKLPLDKLVLKLQNKGFENTPYCDEN